jgi:hypothetical protein
MSTTALNFSQANDDYKDMPLKELVFLVKECLKLLCHYQACLDETQVVLDVSEMTALQCQIRTFQAAVSFNYRKVFEVKNLIGKTVMTAQECQYLLSFCDNVCELAKSKAAKHIDSRFSTVDRNAIVGAINLHMLKYNKSPIFMDRHDGIQDSWLEWGKGVVKGFGSFIWFSAAFIATILMYLFVVLCCLNGVYTLFVMQTGVSFPIEQVTGVSVALALGFALYKTK